MIRFSSIGFTISLLILLSACAAGSAGSGASLSAMKSAPYERMFIKKSSLTIESLSPEKAAKESQEEIEKLGGYQENSSSSGESRIGFTFRVPAENLEVAVAKLSELGSVTSNSMSKTEVTEQYIDAKAKLENSKALRDRLRQLLNRAKDVTEILAIERELTRIQTEIDSLEGKLKVMKGQVNFSQLNFTIEKQKIPGPLGLLYEGIAWTIGKLFVLN
jgi:hypothetical protein